MDETSIKKLVDQYIDLNFSIEKNVENMIKGQISGDLTNDQQYMLRYINKVEVCTSSELAEIFHVKKSAITAIINRLWDKGLIQRTRDEKDRRIVYLTLTDAGKAMFNQSEARIHKLVASFITQFDQEEIEAFMKTYEKLNTIILAEKDKNLGE
ncbi:MarR family winged helix-turn-helix transcriptional regulator [Niallia endozanthoxylica]|uniref:MarR family transcriptional regulator n=1 Tax=Niallia endozanthoxylica TaxID=2036016 RepID=A0A5J5HPJ1_9BACI|nr:MarR family transcriptional regulator [Niallia endozanthoxylica]KAA9021758.1 MarR family transcriptional regulator [Niallia endozanthoxylica]